MPYGMPFDEEHLIDKISDTTGWCISDIEQLNTPININVNKMQTVPYYDLPQSPILIIGFFGIMFTLVLLLQNRAD